MKTILSPRGVATRDLVSKVWFDDLDKLCILVPREGIKNYLHIEVDLYDGIYEAKTD